GVTIRLIDTDGIAHFFRRPIPHLSIRICAHGVIDDRARQGQRRQVEQTAKCNQISQVDNDKQGQKDLTGPRIQDEPLESWRHACLLYLSEGDYTSSFPRSSASTLGNGAGLASRIFSAVQCFSTSSGCFFTRCPIIVADLRFSERFRFHANRKPPTSKPKRAAPIRGNGIRLYCCAIILFSF